MSEQTLCPTCGRAPSEANRMRMVDDGGGHFDEINDRCPDPIHDLADRAPEMAKEIETLKARLDDVDRATRRLLGLLPLA